MFVLFAFQAYALHIAAVRASHYVEIAWFEDGVAFAVVIGEHGLCDVEADGLAFASFKMDALEAFQFLYRANDGCHRIVYVELDNFVSGTRASVLNCY